jgi:ABC-2 type transport system ATP-binding protein
MVEDADHRHMPGRCVIRTVVAVDTDRQFAVAARGVAKHYGRVHALRALDLQIPRGQIVALLGPNGSGKSTTFELLLGLARPSSGELAVLGERPGGAVRRHVGAMLQSGELPEAVTVTELVGLIGRSYPAAVPAGPLLARLGLAPKRTALVSTLSGGERQRVRLAMALVGAPRLLLLDEPTVAMDLSARDEFWKQVHLSVGHGATLLFATHDLHEAFAQADRVVMLHRGRVVADGSPAELSDSNRIELEDLFRDLTSDDRIAPPELRR